MGDERRESQKREYEKQREGEETFFKKAYKREL